MRHPGARRKINRVMCFFSLLACVYCRAGALPIVGVLEQVPVMANGSKVNARPIFVFTDQKLSAATVFEVRQGSRFRRPDEKIDNDTVLTWTSQP